jgi:NitT/TauT family transport system substrate-binding protein
MRMERSRRLIAGNSANDSFDSTDRRYDLIKKITCDIAGGSVFSLPWLVARDEGLFAAEKLQVQMVRSPKRKERLRHLADATRHITGVDSTGNHLLFERGKAQFQRGCEWGQIRRAYDSKLGGRVISKRSAVVSQAIIVRGDSPYNHPQDLRDVAVGVHFHAGSQYLTLQMLEGFLYRDEIKVVHIPVSAERYKALLKGVVDAVTLPEPFISLAEKQKCKLICEAYCVGSEVASPDIDAETHAAIGRAIKKAVRLIDNNKKKYLRHFIADVPAGLGSLRAADFRLSRLRYVDPSPYSPEEFERACKWMMSWDLLDPDAAFDRLVDNRIAAG